MVLYIYILDFHGKDKNGNLLSPGTAVFLKLQSFYSLGNYIR